MQLSALVLVAALFLSTATAATGQSTNPVLGLLLPPEEPEAASLSNGVLLAVAEANASSTRKVSVVIRGRVGQWGADAVEAARMVLDDGALGLISPPDGAATHLALQVAGRTAVPVITLCGDSSVSRTGVPWMLRVVPRTTEEAEALLKGIKPGTGEPAWTAVVPGGRAGREITNDLNAAARAAHCRLSEIVRLDSPLTNAQAICDRLVAANPSGILLWLAPGEAGLFVKQLRTAGFTGVLAGPARLNCPVFTSTAGSALEGFMVPGILLSERDQAAVLHFAEGLKNRFGCPPDYTSAVSHDAALLLIRILGQTDASDLPRAFPLGFSLPGASGLLTFDAAGNRILGLRLLKAERGSFVEMEPLPDRSSQH